MMFKQPMKTRGINLLPVSRGRKACNQCQALFFFSANGGKTVNLCQARENMKNGAKRWRGKTFDQCQAWENMFSVLKAGKHLTCVNRGKLENGHQGRKTSNRHQVKENLESQKER